ncbi:MAG: hypothetical protein F6K65_09205 [Moorea sp. SIO3C2]|nr:hypothetical protein [Moorena sp. SIO3C2]
MIYNQFDSVGGTGILPVLFPDGLSQQPFGGALRDGLSQRWLRGEK